MTRTRLAWTIIAFVLLAPASHALDRVVGDSLSLPSSKGAQSWPDLVFGDAVDNHSIHGVGTDYFTEVCQSPSCDWANGAAGDVWWVLLGNNDHRTNTEHDPAVYRANLLLIADMIETRNGAADIRLISSPYSFVTFGGPDRQSTRAFRDDQAAVDASLCQSDSRFTCVADLRTALHARDNLVWDGVHLSDQGVRTVAALVAEQSKWPFASKSMAVLLVALGVGPGGLAGALRTRAKARRRSADSSAA